MDPVRQMAKSDMDMANIMGNVVPSAVRVVTPKLNIKISSDIVLALVGSFSVIAMFYLWLNHRQPEPRPVQEPRPVPEPINFIP